MKLRNNMPETAKENLDEVLESNSSLNRADYEGIELQEDTAIKVTHESTEQGNKTVIRGTHKAIWILGTLIAVSAVTMFMIYQVF